MYHLYIRPIIHFYEVMKISRKIMYISRRALSLFLSIVKCRTNKMYGWRSCFSIVFIISPIQKSEEAQGEGAREKRERDFDDLFSVVKTRIYPRDLFICLFVAGN